MTEQALKWRTCGVGCVLLYGVVVGPCATLGAALTWDSLQEPRQKPAAPAAAHVCKHGQLNIAALNSCASSTREP